MATILKNLGILFFTTYIGLSTENIDSTKGILTKNKLVDDEG